MMTDLRHGRTSDVRGAKRGHRDIFRFQSSSNTLHGADQLADFSSLEEVWDTMNGGWWSNQAIELRVNGMACLPRCNHAERHLFRPSDGTGHSNGACFSVGRVVGLRSFQVVDETGGGAWLFDSRRASTGGPGLGMRGPWFRCLATAMQRRLFDRPGWVDCLIT